jgi:hypothetical protein
MSTSTTKLLSGLQNDPTTYKFKVAAVNVAGTGNYSAPSSGITPISTGFNALSDLANTISWNSATELMDAVPGLSNGVYIINNYPTYCLMDTSLDGGGWMLAMKATRGTTFNYNANYWTTSNTLNPTDTTRNDADAKFNIFNTFTGTQAMAIWPDLNVSGGSINAPTYGWIWKQSLGFPTTLLNRFQNTLDLGTPFDYSGFNSDVWSYQDGYRKYGFNMQGYVYSTITHVRWGFVWNNEGDNQTCDASGGIGMSFNTDYSAGDKFNAAGTQRYDRSMRVEIYVR